MREDCYPYSNKPFYNQEIYLTPYFTSFSHGQTESTKMYKIIMTLISFSEENVGLVQFYFFK